MRKLIVQQWVTANNIAAEEDGGLSFVKVSAFAEKGDQDLADVSLAFIETVDTMILGANTYAMMKDYWPAAKEQGEYGLKLNSLAKVVASTKLKSAPWGSFSEASITSNPVETVKQLKQQNGKDLWLWGSLTLMQAMFTAGLVDEVHLRICPVTRDRGRPMFEQQHKLKLLAAQTFENGVVMLKYAINQ